MLLTVKAKMRMQEENRDTLGSIVAPTREEDRRRSHERGGDDQCCINEI